MADTASKQIYNDIKNKILSGAIRPNELLNERGLATNYNVSKAPIREALRQLCQEGFLISYPRKGYLQNIITEKEYEQIRQVRIQLEPLSVKLVIQHASDEEIQSLLDHQSEQPEESHPYNMANTKFHLALAKLSGNDYLHSALHDLLGASARAFIFRHAREGILGIELHDAIVAKMLARDEEGAIATLVQDIERSAP